MRWCGAPETFEQLSAMLDDARQKVYASVRDSYALGTTAMAVIIVRRATHSPIGTLSVAGPTMRLSDDRMNEILPWLKSSARELEAASSSSPIFAP
ncbi:IclR family transcriptional regulator domain-containing protein [Rhizobium vallis]|uniref:IclR family transcriptional regulator domain-containing protein n=1 Tax=Rhizobium vallis TaxID=634290 RepID=UPI00247889DD|nr:IclR family transcriptional regulator C-terminal domain-containing protein [Rhizobium vallis]